MPLCYSMLPNRFEDGRHDSIHKGFEVSGYEVTQTPIAEPGPDDVLVSWNTYGIVATEAKKYRRHLVAEEGYLQWTTEDKYFAIGLNGHNGQNENVVQDVDRWLRWQVPFAPWRTRGRHILVCGQRGFGYNEMAMPDIWIDEIYDELSEVARHMGMPIYFRPHPKRRRRMPNRPYDKVLDYHNSLSNHLRDAWAVVVWTSNAATQALLTGVPVFYCGPNIITAGAAEESIADLLRPNYPDRVGPFSRLAWSQFSIGEIETGWAIRTALGDT